MTLRLTSELLARAYDFLVVTPPYRRWKLPPSSEVKFRVTRSKTTRGYHTGEMRNFTDHEIGISEVCIGSTEILIQTMGHEIIHLYQRRRRLETKGVEHNADFHKRAAIVCKHHVFDPKAFL